MYKVNGTRMQWPADAFQHDSPSCQLGEIWRTTQVARFMWPTRSPPGSCRPHVGPTLAPRTLLSGEPHLMTSNAWVPARIDIIQCHLHISCQAPIQESRLWLLLAVNNFFDAFGDLHENTVSVLFRKKIFHMVVWNFRIANTLPSQRIRIILMRMKAIWESIWNDPWWAGWCIWLVWRDLTKWTPQDWFKLDLAICHCNYFRRNLRSALTNMLSRLHPLIFLLIHSSVCDSSVIGSYQE